MTLDASDPCPCTGAGESRTYGQCCGPALAGERWPDTAEALMRSRYSAFAVGDEDHLFRTWHPRTRPAGRLLEDDVTWTGLEVRGTSGGGAEDETGTVDFRAQWSAGGDAGVLEENSTFARRAGRWMYLEPIDG